MTASHSHHRRRSRHGHQEPPRNGWLPFLIAALCLWATIPFGGVATWVQSSVVIGCLLLAVLGYAVSCRDDTARVPGRYWIVASCLGLWILVQTVPLPVGVLAALQPLARADYQALFEGVGRRSIAFDAFLTRGTVMLWVAYGLLAWTCARCLRSRRIVRRFLFCLVGIGTLQAFSGIVVSGTGLWESNPFATNRLSGTFSSGNSFGGFLAVTFPVTVALLLSVAPRLIEDARIGNIRAFLHARAHKRQIVTTVLLSIALVSQAVAILLSGSRGATISASICSILLILWFVFSAEGSVRAGTVRILLISLGLVALLGIGGAYAVIALRFSHMIEEPEAVISRVEIWRASWRLLAAHPLGVGPGCYGLAFQRFQPPGFGAMRNYHAHCDYLEVLCELGIIGLIPSAGLAALFFSGITRRIRRKSGAYSSWMWRGALLAVCAGLLHAFVDFNLTSRPGVAMAFFALVGVVFGYHPIPRRSSDAGGHQTLAVPPVGAAAHVGVFPAGRWARADSTAAAPGVAAKERRERASHSRDDDGLDRHCPSPVAWARVLLLGLLCAVLVVCEARRAVASWLVESGRVSLGAARNKYFWLRPAQAKPELAPEMLREALRRVPRSSRSHYAHGMGKIRLHAGQKDAAIEANLARLPDLSKEEVATLVYHAMALERVAAYAGAQPDFLRALDLSPWDPDAHVALSRCLAESADSEADAARVEDLCRRAMTEAETAVRLAPSDAGTLARACSALSVCRESLAGGEEPVEEIVGLMRKWGRHSLWLEGGVDGKILEAWRAAGVPVLEAIASSDVPPRLLWRTCRFFDERGDGRNALKSLDLLEQILSDENRTVASFDSEQADRQAESYGSVVVREKSRWFLRLGQWARYRGLLEQRRAVHRAGLDAKMRDKKGVQLSGQARYLRLMTMRSGVGLDVDRGLQLCRIQIDRAERVTAENDLAEIAMLDGGETVPYLERFFESGQALRKDGFAWDLARTRILLGRGDQGPAEDMLKDLVDSPRLPLRFRHRVRVLLARCLVTRGDVEAARRALVEAVEECPADPDAVEMLLEYGGDECLAKDADGRDVPARELLAKLIPACEVGMSFLGGKAELIGFELAPGPDRRRAETVLRTFWRFWGSVPTDLELIVASRNARGRDGYWRRIMFTRAVPTGFAAGRPRFGQTIVVDVPLAWKARIGRAMVIGLRAASDDEWLRSAEGLPYMETYDWERYIRDDTRSPVVE